MRSFPVHRAGPFAGALRVPGDKSISHRAAILGGLAAGTTEVSGFLPSDDCLCTLAAMRAIKQALDPLGLMNPGKVLAAD